MTELLFRTDPYAREASAMVTGLTSEGGIQVDRSVFYPTGGGQPGDSGWLIWQGRRLAIATTVKSATGGLALVPAEPAALPPIGAEVLLALDWERRYRHMRTHTALHLLSVVIPMPVTGGQIGTERGRLDFDMPDPPDNILALESRLNGLIEADLKVGESWITDAELAARPELVRPCPYARQQGRAVCADRHRRRRGQGRSAALRRHPCRADRRGGPVEIDRVEKKGRANRRVSLKLAD